MGLSDVQFHNKPNQPMTVPLMICRQENKARHAISPDSWWVDRYTLYAQESIGTRCTLNNQPYSYIFM